MSSSSVTKVQRSSAARGEMGQVQLAAGTAVAMRLWDAEQPGEPKPPAAREYETVGFVISGSAQLHLEGQVVDLEAGDSWVVPAGAQHTYEIVSEFTAVEATTPPAQERGRDEPPPADPLAQGV